MQSFHINSFSAAVIVATLFMGLLGAFVLIPIGCIQWMWNSCVTQVFALPIINAWQAVLLYMAGVCLLYLFGLVKIEIRSDALDESSGTEHLRNYLQERISAKHKSGKEFFRDKDPTEKKDQ
jgi:hypothetical protein